LYNVGTRMEFQNYKQLNSNLKCSSISSGMRDKLVYYIYKLVYYIYKLYKYLLWINPIMIICNA